VTLKVPQADPRAGYLSQKAEIDAAIAAVLARGAYILGPEVEAFEQEFAAFIGVGFAVGVASGTDAISLGLRALGIGAGETVATVSHTATATVAAIGLAGAAPVLVDVEPDSFNLDPEALERLFASSPAGVRAVVPVHLYGRPARMAEIGEAARSHGAVVLEDASQAHGAAIGGRRVGGFGAMAAFSLYPTKNLGALGDAGVLVTDDAALAARARRLREYGWNRRFVAGEAGMNSRLDELQAAVLRVKLRRLDQANGRRRAIAAAYADGLRDLPLALPGHGPDETHAWHQYVVRLAGRDRVRAALAAQGVATAIHYPEPAHRQPAYAGRLAQGPGGLAVTERLSGEILSLPIYPELADDAVAQVIEAMRRALA
jgi:dTDP-4-amino-4,6-dideoxygalactose transaminase